MRWAQDVVRSAPAGKVCGTQHSDGNIGGDEVDLRDGVDVPNARCRLQGGQYGLAQRVADGADSAGEDQGVMVDDTADDCGRSSDARSSLGEENGALCL